MKVKVTERSALVQIAASTQQITAHAGLVLVRELAAALGVAELLDGLTVKKRARGYSPGQQLLALCETLIAGGECLDDAALLRADAAQAQLRGHAVPDPTTLGRFLAGFNLGHLRQFDRALDELFTRTHPLLDRETMTLDLDATLVEHHGPVGSRQGTRGTYTGKIAWHPLLCFVGETGSGCTASCATATPPPRAGAPASWPSASTACRPACACTCASTRASGGRTASLPGPVLTGSWVDASDDLGGA